MSMIVLNSQFNERYPTVINGLVYTYPFDGSMQCCVNNLRYANILSLKYSGDFLYKYFQNKGAIITNLDMDIENAEIPMSKGQYNLVIIDNEDKELSEIIIRKIKSTSKNCETSFIVKSNNTPETSMNIGGSFVYINSIIDESTILDAITKSSMNQGYTNGQLFEEYLQLSNGYFIAPWDNRMDSFAISLDVYIEKPNGNVGIACIANEGTPLLSIFFDTAKSKFEIVEGREYLTPEIYRVINFESFNKIIIVKYGNKVTIFLNDILCYSAYIATSTKGNKLIIGKNGIANIDNTTHIRIKGLSVYDKNLNSKEIDILNNGRFIFN